MKKEEAVIILKLRSLFFFLSLSFLLFSLTLFIFILFSLGERLGSKKEEREDVLC